MSSPNVKSELHELVDEYVRNWTGEPQEAAYLHEEIDKPEKRGHIFEQFMEYVNN